MGQPSRAKAGPPVDTRFKPGQSGNPTGKGGGRPKGIVQQIREATNDGALIIQVVSEILQNPKASNKDRMNAAEFLKNHGFGKAPDIALTGTLADSERSQVAAALADSELEALARKLKPADTQASGQVIPLASAPNSSESLDKSTD